MRLVSCVLITLLCGCTTESPRSQCNYSAPPMACKDDGSIDFKDGQLYLMSPVCSKVTVRMDGCEAHSYERWVEKVFENPSGYQSTGKPTSGCAMEVQKGSCRVYPLR